MTDKIKVDPCPFCGAGQEMIGVQMVSDKWALFCLVCKAQGPQQPSSTLAYHGWSLRREPE
jgi:hypothetical protein